MTVLANKTHVLESAELRRIALEAGADDCGMIGIGRAEIADQRADILAARPGTQTLLALCLRMNREPIRTPARSVANLEFHATGAEVDHVARRIVRRLESMGIAAANPAMAFPMEMDRYPGKAWIVSHKPVAVAAGLGRMGIHRNVIHPVFGNFILLGTVLIDVAVTEESRPIDYNPCFECRLCVAACPVGAIAPDGRFDFTACMTHNYREFMGGFADWTNHVVEARDAGEFRERVSVAENASVWQSLTYGANYKAAYCIAVCPAGEDVIGPYLADKHAHAEEVLRPLQQKKETLYVLPGSDAEAHATKRFPWKPRRRVRSTLRATSLDVFLFGVRLRFQPGRAGDLRATYHFTFTGESERLATIVIADKTMTVLSGHTGSADLTIVADGRRWLDFVNGDVGILRLLITRKVRVRGPLRLLAAFGKALV